MAVTTFTKNFISTISNFLPLNCGIPDSVLNGISGRYIVNINARNSSVNATNQKTDSDGYTLKMKAYLQDKIKLSVGSNWDGIGEVLGGVDKAVDTAVQAITTLVPGANKFGPRSLFSTVSSRRKWAGSSPIGIELQLKFEAIKDIYSEVLQPCMALQQLVLPSKGGDKTGGFFLVPPGPSPFNWGESELFGDIIEVDIGGFITLSRVIIKNVDVVYENRMSAIGPIGAVATVHLESYEMLTKEGVAEMYNRQNTPVTNNTIGNKTKQIIKDVIVRPIN